MSNKGGVGKTTVATNLAIYLRALHEDLPILLFSLDDQGIIERMFGFDGEPMGDGNVKHGWAERSFERLVHLGQYGVHYVPSAPDTALLKARAEDPATLRRHPRAHRVARRGDRRHQERSRGADAQRAARRRPRHPARSRLGFARGGGQGCRDARARPPARRPGTRRC